MPGRLSPENLGGHAFSDNCLPNKSLQNGSSGASPRALRRHAPALLMRLPMDLIQWETKERARVREEMDRFFESPGEEPLVVLQEGEVFRLSDWPKGTVVRFERNTLHRGMDFSDVFLFGVIAQARTKVGGFLDAVINARSELTPGYDRPLVNVPYDTYKQKIIVGEVFHERYGKANSDHDNLYQIAAVEIWRRGQASREQGKAPSFKPKKAR